MADRKSDAGLLSRGDEMRSFDRDLLLDDPDIWAPDDWRDPIYVDKAVLWWLLEGWAESMPCRCTLASW